MDIDMSSISKKHKCFNEKELYCLFIYLKKGVFMTFKIKLILKLFCILFLGNIISCSTDDTDYEREDINEEEVPTKIKPSLKEDALKLVGSWSGQGPYMIVGGNPNKAGLVIGTWEFYNDSTYSWIGHNTYGYKYEEEGKWHYNVENKMLVTDSPCSFNWKIEECLEEQWLGTLLNRGGTYTYIRKDKELKIGIATVADYKGTELIVCDTIRNYEFFRGELQCGICYGEEDNNDVETFRKLYANNIHSQISLPKNVVNRGIFNVTLKNLEPNGKYKIAGFMEKDGVTTYGKIKKIINVMPPQDAIYMGGDINAEGYVYFWGKGDLGADKKMHNPVEETGRTSFERNYAYGGKLNYDGPAYAISDLGDNWILPDGNEDKYFWNLSDISKISDTIIRLTATNGNQIYFNVYHPDGYGDTTTIWRSDYYGFNAYTYDFLFTIGSHVWASKISTTQSSYKCYVRPVTKFKVVW